MPVNIAMFDGNKAHLPLMESVGPLPPSHTDVVGFPISHASILGGMYSSRGATAMPWSALLLLSLLWMLLLCYSCARCRAFW